MNCNDCIHCDMCDGYRVFDQSKTDEKCKHFKDKNRIVELPCKIEDNAYVLWKNPIDSKYILYHCICKGFEIRKINLSIKQIYKFEPIEFRGRILLFYLEDFDKTVFLTREEAEKKLQEYIMPENSDHRKQRGRTAPNRKDKEE